MRRNHPPQQQTTALDQLVDLSWLALADEPLPEVAANVSADRVTGGEAGPEEPANEPGRMRRAAGHPADEDRVGEDLVAQEGHVPGDHGGEDVAASAAALSVTSPRPEADDDVHFGVAAHALGVSRKTVERMVKRGELERGPSNAWATVSKRALVSTLEARRRNVSQLTRATEIERSKSVDEYPAAAPAAAASAMTELGISWRRSWTSSWPRTRTAVLENELERLRARGGHDRARDERCWRWPRGLAGSAPDPPGRPAAATRKGGRRAGGCTRTA